MMVPPVAFAFVPALAGTTSNKAIKTPNMFFPTVFITTVLITTIVIPTVVRVPATPSIFIAPSEKKHSRLV
jgi:hypothetical protein